VPNLVLHPVVTLANHDLFSRSGLTRPKPSSLYSVSTARWHGGRAVAFTLKSRWTSALRRLNAAGGFATPATHPGAADDAIALRCARWFFARKPDAGFVLSDFPATLAPSPSVDEWARGPRLEALTPVLAPRTARHPAAEPYRTLRLPHGDSRHRPCRMIPIKN